MNKRSGLLLMASVLTACPAKEDATPPSDPTATDAPPPAAPASQPVNPHGEEFKEVGPPGKPISGLVKLGEGVAATDVKPTDVLFVMVRQSMGGGKFGRLIAVQRHGQIEFPKRYEISSSDVMVPGIPFQGPFIVMARLDRDGDPMTRKPEDLFAVIKNEVQNGDEGVHLTLEKATVQDVAPPEGAAPPPMQGQPQNPASQPAKQPASQPAKQPASQPAKR